MQQAQIAVEQEIRYHKVGAPTVAMWKYLREGPEWLHGDELIELGKFKENMIALETKKQEEALAHKDDVDFTSLRTPNYSLIKSGKFGPDIEDFTMPLPVTFPLRAGQAKYALKPALVEHEKVISKLRVQALPSTLEDVKVNSIAVFIVRMTSVFVCIMRAGCTVVFL